MRRAIVLLAAISAGCSLLGLDNFEVPQCTEHSQCAVLNAADGISESTCLRWQCDQNESPFYCKLEPRDFDQDGVSPKECATGPVDCDDRDPRIHPAHRECCDGLDNDCNGIIDEGAARFVERSSLAVDESDRLVPATWLGGRQAIVKLSGEGSELSARLEDPLGTSVERAFSFQSQCGNELLPQDIALDFTGQDLAGLLISTGGCAVGIATIVSKTMLIEGGEAITLTASCGIDLVDEGGLVCTGHGDHRGAAKPAFKRLADGSGLAAWIARPARNSSVASDLCAVGDGTPRWVRVFAVEPSTTAVGLGLSGIGPAIDLGLARGSGGPAIVASSDHWYLAYAAAGGGIDLAKLAVRDRALSIVRQHLDAEGPLDQVHLALGANSELALVWQRCSSPRSILSQRVRDLGGGFDRSAPILDLTGPQADGASPVVAYSPRGLRTTTPAGGSWIAWTQVGTSSRAIAVARIVEGGGGRIAERIAPPGGNIPPGVRITIPLALSVREDAPVELIFKSSGFVRGGSLGCVPAPFAPGADPAQCL